MRAGCVGCLMAVMLVAGCDDHVFEAHSSGGGEVPEGGYEATWDGVQNFFIDHCDTCHETTSPVLRPTIEAEIAAGGGPNVVPGDSGASKLWLSVSHSNGATPMPFGSSEPLPDEAILHIQTWIDDGAAL
jgi:hypothetical protein